DLVGPPELNVTSEGAFTVEYQLKGDPSLPKGYPFLHIQTSGLKLAAKDQGRAKGREVRSVGLDKAEPLVQFTFEHRQDLSSDPRKVAKITAVAWYRGQRVVRETTVVLYNRADIIAYHYPKPKDCGVAVRADAATWKEFEISRGVLSIVLDWS